MFILTCLNIFINFLQPFSTYVHEKRKKIFNFLKKSNFKEKINRLLLSKASYFIFLNTSIKIIYLPCVSGILTSLT